MAFSSGVFTLLDTIQKDIAQTKVHKSSAVSSSTQASLNQVFASSINNVGIEKRTFSIVHNSVHNSVSSHAQWKGAVKGAHANSRAQAHIFATHFNLLTTHSSSIIFFHHSYSLSNHFFATSSQ